ncbi:hypothetical protein ACWCZ5_03590 [Streptomyces sp. NPDC001667]
MSTVLVRSATTVALAALAVGGLAVTTPAFAGTADKAKADVTVDCPRGVSCQQIGGKYGSAWALARQGNMAYVADRDNGRVHAVDLTTGQTVKTFAVPYASGVAVEGDTLYVVSSVKGSVVAVPLGSGNPRTIAEGLGGASNIALDGAGHAYVTGSSGLYRVNLADGGKEIVDYVPGADGVALDGHGKAYVTGNQGLSNTLTEVDLAGHGTRQITQNLNTPKGVALDGAGNAYVFQEAGVLTKVRLSDGRQETISTGLSDGRGLNLDLTTGDIYATNSRAGDNGTLWRITNVLQPSAPLKADVRQRPYAPAEGRPGDQPVYPSVEVVNTGTRRIDTERVVVEAPKELQFLDTEVRFIRSDQPTTELKAQCRVLAERHTLDCGAVPLNLDAGDKWTVLFAPTSINKDARPGDVHVDFRIGNPVFAEGKAKVTIKP